MAKYQKIDIDGVTVSILKKEDVPANTRVTFPIDDDSNVDYIEYKAWVDAGNTPDASS